MAFARHDASRRCRTVYDAGTASHSWKSCYVPGGQSEAKFTWHSRVYWANVNPGILRWMDQLTTVRTATCATLTLHARIIAESNTRACWVGCSLSLTSQKGFGGEGLVLRGQTHTSKLAGPSVVYPNPSRGAIEFVWARGRRSVEFRSAEG